MIEQRKSLTVRALLAELRKHDLDREVKIWLPGSKLYLTGFLSQPKGALLIEGNVEPGSALCVDQ